MKIELFDLAHRSTQQTTRLEGLSQRDLAAATWRGDDLLLRTRSGEVVVLKDALNQLLAKPGYFLLLDDRPLPLAAFAADLQLPAARSAPHVPPFSVTLPFPVGAGPLGRRGVQRKAVESDERWADQARELLSVSAAPAADVLREPLHAAAPVEATTLHGTERQAEGPARALTGEPTPSGASTAAAIGDATGTSGAANEPSAQSATATAAASPGFDIRSIDGWTWLSWAAIGKASYEFSPKPQAAPAPASSASARTTSASQTAGTADKAVAVTDTNDTNGTNETNGTTDTAGSADSADSENSADSAVLDAAMRALTGGHAGTDASLPASPSAAFHAAAAGSSAADLLAASAASMAVIG